MAVQNILASDLGYFWGQFGDQSVRFLHKIVPVVPKYMSKLPLVFWSAWKEAICRAANNIGRTSDIKFKIHPSLTL